MLFARASYVRRDYDAAAQQAVCALKRADRDGDKDDAAELLIRARLAASALSDGPVDLPSTTTTVLLDVQRECNGALPPRTLLLAMRLCLRTADVARTTALLLYNNTLEAYGEGVSVPPRELAAATELVALHVLTCVKDAKRLLARDTTLSAAHRSKCIEVLDERGSGTDEQSKAQRDTHDEHNTKDEEGAAAAAQDDAPSQWERVRMLWTHTVAAVVGQRVLVGNAKRTVPLTLLALVLLLVFWRIRRALRRELRLVATALL